MPYSDKPMIIQKERRRRVDSAINKQLIDLPLLLGPLLNTASSSGAATIVHKQLLKLGPDPSH